MGQNTIPPSLILAQHCWISPAQCRPKPRATKSLATRCIAYQRYESRVRLPVAARGMVPILPRWCVLLMTHALRLRLQSLTVHNANPTRVAQADDDLHLVNLWLRGKSAHSQAAYRRDVDQFIDLVDLPLCAIRLQHFWQWADHLQSRGLALNSQARKLAAVKSLFSFGHRIGYLEYNVGAAVTLPSVPDRLNERILSEAVVHRILDLETDLRNGVLLRLFYASGARVSELAHLYWGAFMDRGMLGGKPVGQVTLLGKGQKTRTVLLSADSWGAIAKLREAEMEKGFGARSNPVFRSRKGGSLSRQQIWRIVRKAARRAGLDQAVSPHWLRHAHASHALDNGAPIHLV